MAITVPRRKPKKFNKSDYEDDYQQKLSDPCFCRLLNKVPIALLFLFLVFLWSSSSTFLSGSIVHVCVSSRKLNLYCLSAGTQPANYSIPLIQSNSSEFPAFEKVTVKPREEIHTYAILPHESIREQKFTAYDSPFSNQILKKDNIEDPVFEIGSNTPSTLGELVLNETPESLVFSPEPHEEPENPPPNVDSAPEVKSPEPREEPEKPPPNVDSAPEPREEPENTPPNVDSAPEVEAGEIQTYAVLEEKSPPYDGNWIQNKDIDNARKYVEEHVAVLRSYIPKSKAKDCDGRGIYVYDLPTKFNKDLTSQCGDMISWLDFCKCLSNEGMGESIPELGKDWYNTHQYSLEPILHSLALKHPCRVYNWEDAKLFYVPFYGGLDILRWHFKDVTNEVKDALSNELVGWLEQQKPWKRHFGLDHVFVLGKISWDFRRVNNGTWGTCLLELDEMQNPMKLLIERQPWETNDVGIPYPTYFHPSSDEAIIEWQSKIRGAHRGSLVSFAGTPRVPAKELRETLIEQCTSAPNTCKFIDCREQSCTNPALTITLFTESEFCLQPPGDSPTRKSFFDSLVGGCIPVVFDPMTAHYQYPWHLPQDHTKYSVFIDQDEVKMSKVNVIERLMKISLKEREEKRKYIIDELMPKLVFSNPNAKLHRFEDAFSVAVNSLLEMTASKVP